MRKAIKVENLSKAYQIGEFSTGTLSKDLERWWALSRGKEDPFLKIGETNVRSTKGESNVVWSLNNLNFEINQGEAIGIIGKNGAGKSTLLKVLSQVTTPTRGTIKMKGKVASLLEVGTGFHPELTGRENIYLNGAILGLTKHEISMNFDEIVDFSGVERYIDTPVKRYSSGMYVRLAFAVAAHLISDILIIDEVLAVGDADFQKKAVGKMKDVSNQEGRTILFVSHNLNSIRLLCKNSLLLENGCLVYQNETNNVINKYIENKNTLTGREINFDEINRDKKELVFNNLSFNKFPISFGDKIDFTITLKSQSQKIYNDIDIGVGIQDSEEKRLIHISNKFKQINLSHENDSQSYHIRIENNLAPGLYKLTLFLKADNEIQDWMQNIIEFEISDGNPYKYMHSKLISGIIFPKFEIFQQ